MKNLYKKLAMVCTTIALFTFVAISQTTINVKVTQSADDVEEYRDVAGTTPIGDVYMDSGDLELCTEEGFPIPAREYVGLIFRNVQIPVGATITNAYVQFECDETDADVIQISIWGFKEANTSAPFISTPFNVSSRPKTTAQIAAWSPPEWATVHERGLAQQTPNLKTIIQEIIGLAGWVSGNNVGIGLTSEITVEQHRIAEAYDGEAEGAAELFVTYTTGVGVADVFGSSVSIYPNPTTGKVTINNPSAGKFGYAIYNVIGKVVKTRDDIAGSTAEVDMSSSAKGTYFVEVKSDAKTFKSKLILK